MGLYGAVAGYQGDHQSAREYFEIAVSIDPENNFASGGLEGCYLLTGDTLKWYESWKKYLWWTDDEYLVSLDSIFEEQGYLGVMEERIRVNEEIYKDGGYKSFMGQAGRYLAVGNFDRAMEYVEKEYEKHSGTLPYISLWAIYNPELKYNHRYLALLKKMNLPLPED